MPGFANLLDSKLPPELVEALHDIGELAVSGDAGAGDAYLVGGSVRDLILGRKPLDPDIVVVGNGGRFARAVAEKLKGEVKSVSQFGTAVIDTAVGRMDIVTARSETYAEPAALPTVKPSSIEDDLARRDFSVNAMALSIMPGKWGSLLDPHHGFGDCARRKLRVLHGKSFQDDPTRIFRAVRYSSRLGFKLDVQTAEWLERDLPVIDKLSGARVLAEIRKMLGEPGRADVFEMAEKIGLLEAVSPALRVSESGIEAMRKIGDGADELFYVACMASSLTKDEGDALVARLEPDSEWRAVIAGASKYREIASVLDMPNISPSEIVDLLAPVPAPVLEVVKLTSPKARREHIESYLRRYRDVRCELTGEDLIEAGATKGPIVGTLLAELKTGRLDGKLSSREDELAHVKRRLPMLQSRTDRPTGAAVLSFRIGGATESGRRPKAGRRAEPGRRAKTGASP